MHRFGLKLGFAYLSLNQSKERTQQYLPTFDKLLRGLLDALTGIAYKDDSQVIDISAEKVYSKCDGADIEIYWLGASIFD